MMKSYSEMLSYKTYAERVTYLQTSNKIGMDTFGYDRYLNQTFYHSSEWRRVRRAVILRDNGCDLGMADRPIVGSIHIHHIEPITRDDVINRSPNVFDMNNLISVSLDTHNAIHYGGISDEPVSMERTRNDTCPWRI